MYGVAQGNVSGLAGFISLLCLATDFVVHEQTTRLVLILCR